MVSLYSTIKMMHGSINIRYTYSVVGNLHSAVASIKTEVYRFDSR